MKSLGYKIIILMGNTPCGQITTTYKVPLNAVNKDYNNFQMIEYKELFQYPARYPYILSYLRKNNMLFEDMYFPTNDPKHIFGAGLLKQLGQPLQWRRINQIARRRNVRYGQTLFHQQPQRYRDPHSIYRLLLWMTSMPQLMRKIFLFQTLNQEGLVLVYLPLHGSHDEPVQIVIDDLIPMAGERQYYCTLPQANNVAMVLLQKALAKIVGSYEKAKSLPMKDLFQILIGLPILVENIGNKDPMSILQRYYRPHYYIVSHNKKLQNHQPEYFKFTLDVDSDVSISIWQLLQNPHSFQLSAPGQIVMQLMKIESDVKVFRVGYSSKLYKDKTFLRTISPEEEHMMFSGRDFLRLSRGNYLLHIYTKTDNVSVNSNLIVYSSSPVNLTYRKENFELSTYKRRMIETVFLQHNKELEKCQFVDRVYSKFIWDGFRGILAFKNEETVRIKITVLIKTEYRRKIKFQHSQQYEEVIFLKPMAKKIISFVKFIETDVGNFYEQTISYLKQDMIQQGMSPKPMFPTSGGSTPHRIDITASPFKGYDQLDSFREEDSMLNQSKQFVAMRSSRHSEFH